MKVLFIVPYITSNRHPVFLRNRTGLGYMIYDIAKYVGQSEHVELFAVNSLAPSVNMENFKTVGRSWGKFIKHFSVKSLYDGLKFIGKYKVPLKEKYRILYQFMAIAQAEKMMNNFDIIHIHGCSPITDAAIKACKRQNKPFVVTLHGLVSFEKEVKLHPSLKQYERDFLVEAYFNNYNVSFISSGNKETAESFIHSNLSE